MRLPSDMLFVPRWLSNIQPTNLANRFAGDPVYSPSRLTAKTVNSSQRTTATGTIVPKEEQLAHQASIVSNREARKAKRRQEMREQSAGNWMNYMEVRAERRAAKEAKRIMEERRQEIIAAFASQEDV